MSVIAICGASQCYSEEVSKLVAEKLSYAYVGDELLNAAAEKYDVSKEDLEASISGKYSIFGLSEKERRKYISYLKYELAETILADNVVLNNLAIYLLPKDITHILRVCLVADFEWRVRQITDKGQSEKQAREIIKEDDHRLFSWVDRLHGIKPWSKRLFDIIEPMQDNSIDQTVDLIVKYVRKPILQSTDEAVQSLNDFVLASKVSAHFAAHKHDVEVSADSGEVTIYVQTYTLRMSRYKKELESMAQKIDGVTKVNMSIGKNINLPSILPQLDFDIPKNVLLVDDETEFVQTLSERLQTRKYEPKIALNGEEALASIKKDQPEVIVLDLKMPGISGFDVLREVKANHPDTEVIILTGHGSEREHDLAFELGAFAYLEKPVDINVLSETMNKAYAKINRKKNSK